LANDENALNEMAQEKRGFMMSDIKHSRTTLVARILEGEGRALAALRRAAFNDAGLVEPVTTLRLPSNSRRQSGGIALSGIWRVWRTLSIRLLAVNAQGCSSW
jgi:hypothetical protein